MNSKESFNGNNNGRFKDVLDEMFPDFMDSRVKDWDDVKFDDLFSDEKEKTLKPSEKITKKQADFSRKYSKFSQGNSAYDLDMFSKRPSTPPRSQESLSQKRPTIPRAPENSARRPINIPKPQDPYERQRPVARPEKTRTPERQKHDREVGAQTIKSIGFANDFKKEYRRIIKNREEKAEKNAKLFNKIGDHIDNGFEKVDRGLDKAKEIGKKVIAVALTLSAMVGAASLISNKKASADNKRPSTSYVDQDTTKQTIRTAKDSEVPQYYFERTTVDLEEVPEEQSEETSIEETTAPETTVSETTTELTTEQETTTKRETTKPETTKPETTKRETTKPATTKPVTTKSETTNPATTKPETTKRNEPNDYLGEDSGSLQRMKIVDDLNLEQQLTQNMKTEIENTKKVFIENYSRYKKISDKALEVAGVYFPPELVCAIHQRESHCNFNCVLQNGDPLGKPTVHVPKGLTYYTFEDSAVAALKQQVDGYPYDQSLYKKGNTLDTMKEICKCANRYNGVTSHVSPYVYSGTTKYIYSGDGMYVSDGVYDSNVKDKRPGVYVLVKALSATNVG